MPTTSATARWSSLRSRRAPAAGRTFRLKGKGMPGKGAPGDLLAIVRIVLPDLDDEALNDLMRKWRDSRPYDPRKDMAEQIGLSRLA